MTNDPARRMREHVDGKPWAEEAVRVDLEWHRDEKAARAAEQAKIAELAPRENVQHNRGNPGRVVRDASGKVVGRGREIAHAVRTRRQQPAPAPGEDSDAGLQVLDQPAGGEGPPEPTMFGASW